MSRLRLHHHTLFARLAFPQAGGQGARARWAAWSGLLALVLALCLVPMAGRVHQVVHAMPLAHAKFHQQVGLDVQAWAGGERVDEPASLGHHQPASALCLLLDQLALGDGAPASMALALAPPVPGAVSLVVLASVATPPTPHFQARAPPASRSLA